MTRTKENSRADQNAGVSTETTSQERTTSKNSAEVDNALAIARKFVAAGVPVVRARPALDAEGNWNPRGGHQGSGYWFPRGWPDAKPDLAAVDNWQPGDGLFAVMGHAVDGLDVDPRNGGGSSYEDLDLLGRCPDPIGRQRTPSGGFHDIINALGVGSRDGFVPGMDLKGGRKGEGSRGLLWIAPTRRLNKVTNEIAAYTWEREPDFALLSDDDRSGDAIAEMIRAAGGPDTTAKALQADPRTYEELSAAEQEQARATVDNRVKGFRKRFSEAQHWDDGERDEYGRGWERLTADSAFILARLGHAAWSPLSLEDAEAEFDEMLPDVIANDPKCAGKWAHKVTAAASKPLPAPWQEARQQIEADFGDPIPASLDSAASAASAPDHVAAGGWNPVDLEPYLDGTHSPPVPTIMPRTDNVCLLYPSMTHSIHGESESGKSMLVQAVAADLLAAGERVLYLDYEADPGSVTERLRLMGAPVEAIREDFTYLQPETDYDNSPASRTAFEQLLGQRFALAVVDGVTEALTQVTAKVRSTGGLGGNDDVTDWHNRLPRRVARATGAAVVQIDHVAKSAEATRFAIGGQAKMASITGAAYYVKPVDALAKGRVGTVEVHVAKDRHGFIRSRAEGEFNSKTRMQLIALAEVDGRGGTIKVALKPPFGRTAAAVFENPEMMERVSAFLAALPDDHEGAGLTMIRREVRGNSGAIDTALRCLVDGGYVAKRITKQGSYHLSLKPFISGFEDHE